MHSGTTELAARLVAGDRAALARALTRLERDAQTAAQFDRLIAPHTGRAYTIGITGAPGAGKSTLVGAMLELAVRDDRRTAVLALDPRSPFTNGAILGDRMRMERSTADARVFVRSMTADAHGGGLSATTPLAVRALDAAGWPTIVIETVGVGQSELDIVEAASTTVVVLNPGWGDEVQSVKAGLLEIADIFVINKAEREGTAELRHDLERLLTLGGARPWRVPILETSALENRGVAALWNSIDAHRVHQVESGQLAARQQRFCRLAVRTLVQQTLTARLNAALLDPAVQTALTSLSQGHGALADVSDGILDRLLGRG
ncbi:MAG: methylmalonyl Co-A mutase-associated GTPase MeaB [Betaproteobacteria bacterium]